MLKSDLRKRGRVNINNYRIEYQRRHKRWAVINYFTYETVAVYLRRGQAYQYALTHLDLIINALMQKRMRKQLKATNMDLNVMAEHIYGDNLKSACEDYRKKHKYKRKSQKSIEKEIKDTTTTSNLT